ncbi:MAG: hypothetical protein HFACDABA_00218 [Anaerolineales bacterium]|nr:hypothetical protein [Anaerolineales bacterium]
MFRFSLPVLLTCLLIIGCSPQPAEVVSDSTEAPIPIDTPTSVPTETAAPLPSDTPSPTETSTPPPPATATSAPLVEKLNAVVVADLLSCRYGPGSEYLFLYGLRKGAQIALVGQTGGNNWVWVEGKNPCWVNVKFIEIEGNFRQLPVVYPDGAPLPRSPYYSATVILSATRSGNTVTVAWLDIPLRAGDEEDDSMLHYIVEVWRCEAGQVIFDPLATNDTSISFVDEPGCAMPSHGNVYVQEKHGFAGPTVIPWPPSPPK